MVLRATKDDIVTDATLVELRGTVFYVYHAIYNKPLATVTEHAKQWGIPRATFQRAVRNLIQLGWLLRWPDRRTGSRIVPWMPLPVEERIADELLRRLTRRPYRGETLMRCMLDLCIDDRCYEDGATPDWLVTGEGGRPMELDRLYLDAAVAFEFQGPQHFRPGEPKSESEVISQRVRDNIKAGLCTRAGITFIEITPLDLTLRRLQEKVGDALPLLPVFQDRPLYRTLHQQCHSYMNYVARRTRQELSRQKASSDWDGTGLK